MEIPGYKVDSQIGKGGMARVYLALHEGLDRKVAIKVMNRQLDDDDSAFSERFMREARIVANLTHQNIITVYDVGMHDGHHYIAMEYLPGGITLDSKIKQGINAEEGMMTIRQVAAALGFAHSKGIVHRDVKPENIMYREDGSAVLTDFGIARAEQSETKMTATGTVIGTPHYMSPEQAQGNEIGPFSDIYSLGVVFHEILTGKVPYDADSTIAVVFKHITEPVPVLEDELAVYQPLLDGMMAKEREQRYNSCEQIITDIDSLANGGEANNATLINNNATLINNVTTINKAAPTPPTQQTTQQPEAPGKKPVLAIALGLIAAIAIGGGGYYYSQQAAEQQRLAEREREEQLRQAELEKQQQQAREAEQRRQAEMKAAQEAEQQRLAILQQQKEQSEREAQQQAAEEELARADREAQKEAELKAAEAARQEKMRKLNSMLAKAEQQLINNDLDSAYNIFFSALQVDANNSRASSGISRIAGQYLSLASIAAASYDFDTANRHISKVIRIAPNHDKLSETQTKVFEYKNEQLLKQAEQQRLSQEQQKTETSKPAEEQKKHRMFGGF